MQLKAFIQEKRAVSPVIGVILMVAITVILAAVIGTFVLGLGDSVNSAPQASIDFNYNTSNNNVNIVHAGGEQLQNSTLSVKGPGDNTISMKSGNAPYTAGDTIASGKYNAGKTIRLIYSSPNSDSTSVIASSEAPA